MAEQIETLGTALPKEIERCQKLLKQYEAIGPVGFFGSSMIKRDIEHAQRAIMEGNCVAMLRSLQKLRDCK